MTPTRTLAWEGLAGLVGCVVCLGWAGSGLVGWAGREPVTLNLKDLEHTKHLRVFLGRISEAHKFKFSLDFEDSEAMNRK